MATTLTTLTTHYDFMAADALLQAIEERRLGIFTLENPENTSAVNARLQARFMRFAYVIRTSEHLYERNVTYWAYSKLFVPIPKGGLIPKYKIGMNEKGELIAFKEKSNDIPIYWDNKEVKE